ncbi:MAG TPA: hypothetical protein VFB66_24010 [Tepidisphaeraceae bacterium]|nr:hypothetical protein [Tepidisphaeraceae bacterium]
MKRRLLKLLTALSLPLCVAAAWPRHGPPDFRYTGSDPAAHVWNFGWPVALVIYDARYGFHVGPFAYLVIPILVFALTVTGSIWSWWNRSASGP